MAAYEAELFEMIEDYIGSDPRTLQTAPGPSGLGIDCHHCLGALLAREPKMETAEDRWLTFIGRCVHEGLARAAEYRNSKLPEPKYLVEQRLVIGQVGEDLVEGNSDVFDLSRGRVIDWKVVGDKTLADVAKYGASPIYVNQSDLYGFGFEELGLEVTGKTIVFLPRNKYRMRDGIATHLPYSRANAEAVLKRANDIAELGRTRGWDTVLPRLKRNPTCRDCPRYAR